MSAARSVPGLPLRLVLVAVVVGVVAMHHLAGGQHCSAPPAAEQAMVMTTHPAPPQFIDPPAAHDDGGSGHLCLAVLAGATVLLLALAFLGVPGTVTNPQRPGPCAPTTRHSRAPPAPRRLAELQVLRV